MQKSSLNFLLKSFLAWRVVTLLVAILAIYYVPLSGINFFGGKYINYITNPLFFGWANFDGEHYLSIAMFGYKDLQLAFFPAYPYLVGFFAKLAGSTLALHVWSGIILSNMFFLGSLILFWKVIRLEYNEKIARIATILLLVFPTSFYFASVYTESMFLFLALLTYYLYRKNKYLLAGLVGILLTLTRLYGVFVLLMTLTKVMKEKSYAIGAGFLGLLSYMLYCFKTKGDFVAFYSLQTNVGEHRSLDLILLPQVFYRYIVKIIPNLEWGYFPVVFTTFLELSVARNQV